MMDGSDAGDGGEGGGGDDGDGGGGGLAHRAEFWVRSMRDLCHISNLRLLQI